MYAVYLCKFGDHAIVRVDKACALSVRLCRRVCDSRCFRSVYCRRSNSRVLGLSINSPFGIILYLFIAIPIYTRHREIHVVSSN